MSDLTYSEKVFNISVETKEKERNVSLIARVLDEDQRMERDRLLVKKASPALYDDLPTASKIRLWALITVRLSLLDIPEWLNELLGTHEALTLAIFSEVDALERDFFCRHMGESKEEERRSSFSIITKNLPQAI